MRLLKNLSQYYTLLLDNLYKQHGMSYLKVTNIQSGRVKTLKNHSSAKRDTDLLYKEQGQNRFYLSNYKKRHLQTSIQRCVMGS